MRSVFIPYFTDIYKDLAQQTELCTTNDPKKNEKEEVTPSGSPDLD